MQIKLAVPFLATILAAAPAFAQGQVSGSLSSSASEAPSRAFEAGLGIGYAQGFGKVQGSGPDINDISHAGAELTLHLGYRATSHLFVGAYGSGSKYLLADGTPDGSDVWSATAGLEANWHFMPDDTLDPWVGLGAGWRGYWVSKPEGVDSRHGLDFARVSVGLDYRVARQFSISPYIGASGTVFLSEKVGQETSFSSIDSTKAAIFIQGGIMGRFDLI
jgi:outer membrane protein W